MKLFFRVLTPTCCGVPGTIESWLAGRRSTGSHNHVPPHWIIKWRETGSTNPNDYKLESYDGCQYTPEARETFLSIAHLHENQLTDEQKFLTGEFEGVPAFDNPNGALEYGKGAYGKSYVVFGGVKLAELEDEKEEGGCRVKVIEQIGPVMNRDQFIRWLSDQGIK